MTSIKNVCVGNSMRLLFALLIVLGANIVDVSKVEAGSLIVGASVKSSVENGEPYLVAPSPVGNNGAYTVMTLTFNKNTGSQVCASMVSTFASWPSSPYDFNISVGTEIPVMGCRTNDSVITNGDYRTFVCLTSPSYNCSGQDWGRSTYPTYAQANSLSDTSYVDFTKGASGVVVNSVQGFDQNYQTRFLDLEITGTSSVNIAVDYFLQQSEIIRTISAFNPTQINFGIALRPTTAISARGVNIDNSVQGTSSEDFTFTSLTDGVYDVNITFMNQGSAIGQSERPFAESYIYSSFTVASGTLTATGTPEFYDFSQDLPTNQPVPCGITAIGGCIQNAFSYLFIPTDNGMLQITNLYDTLSTKFPFAYFTDFNDSITSVFTNPTTESLAISVPFGTFGTLDLISEDMIEAVPFTSLIRELLGAIIWLMMAYTIYRRTFKIFNKETT